MENSVPPSQKSVLLHQYHQRWASHVQPESPIEAYRARLKPVKARFREVNLEFARAGSVAVGGGGDDSFKAVLARLERAFAELKEVSNQEETAEQQERKYQQNLEQDHEAELRELLGLLGPSLSTRVCTQWFADQQAPPTPVQEETEDIVEPTDTTTDSQFALDPDAVERSSRAAPSTTNPTPAADEARRSVASTSSRQKPPKPVSTTPNNKRTRSKSGSSRAKKRSRGDTHSGPLTDKVIEFEKVYQNGNAPKKYVIQEYHKHWYIFRCEEHDKEFPTPNPLLGAIKHLWSNWHYKGTTTVEAKMAIEELGTRVLNCDDTLAKKNNSVPRRSSYDQIGVPERSIRTRSDPAEDTDDNETPTRNTNGTRASLIDPQPGEVYETFWDGDQDFYAVLILPWGNFSQFGISNWDMSLKDTKLLDDRRKIPACYKEYDLSNGTFEWADAYRPGTSKASQRQYPVIYFEKPEFPGACRYGWAHLSRLNTYDPDTSRVLHKSQVDKFLLEYANYRGGNAANAQGHAESRF
jgi:type II secretory pathway pseudopilin PulG